MTRDFWKAVLINQKKLLKNSEVRKICVPKYPELSVKNMGGKNKKKESGGGGKKGKEASNKSPAAASSSPGGPTRVLLLRHGQSEANQQGRDVPDPLLTDLGRCQASAWKGVKVSRSRDGWREESNARGGDCAV